MLGYTTFSILFSAFADVPGVPQAIAIQEEVSVTIPWPQLKALSKILSESIEAIESQVGPIPDSPISVPAGIKTSITTTMRGFGYSK